VIRTVWRRARWWVAAALVVTVLAVVQLATSRTFSDEPYSPDNRDADGTRAVAQVLRGQGVRVEEVRTPQAAVRALDGAHGATTLLVTYDSSVPAEQVAVLPGGATDVVLMAPSSELLDRVAPSVSYAYRDAAGPLAAGCADPDAVAAGSLAGSGTGLVSSTADATSCFVADGAAAMVREGNVTVLDSVDPFVNARVLEAGNAALALRVLGAHETLVWLTPSPRLMAAEADGNPASRSTWLVVLLALGALLVWWRGRRLGPLVAEPLPVVVPSDEVTIGRARLYRRARAAPHAAALLRAGTIDRIASSIGLAPHSDPDQVVGAVARAARRDPHEVRALLYGPAPTTTAALADLTTALDQLAREVRRP